MQNIFAVPFYYTTILNEVIKGIETFLRIHVINFAHFQLLILKRSVISEHLESKINSDDTQAYARRLELDSGISTSG